MRWAEKLEKLFKAILRELSGLIPDMLRGCTKVFLPLLLISACMPQPSERSNVTEAITSTLSSVLTESSPDEQLKIDLKSDFAKALNEVVRSNKAYSAALASERSLLSKVASAESVQRPQIRGNSTVGGVRETGGNDSGKTTKGMAVGVNVSQLIFDGGLSSANIDQAMAQALRATAERQVIGNEIALEAARAWIDYWQYQSRLNILDVRTSEMDDLLLKMERMASNGMMDRSALDSARRQALDMSLEEKLLLNGLDEAKIKFKRFFNQEINNISKPEEFVDLAEARVQANNWQEAPTLRQTAAEVVVANNALKIAKAAFAPQTRLQAGVTSPMDTGDSTDTSIGLLLEYTFGDGGKRDADLKEAEAGLEAAQARLDDVQRVFSAEMEASLNKLNSLAASLPLVSEKISISRVEAETARSQLSTGQTNLRQLIDAELENYRAEDKQVVLNAEKLVLQFGIAAKTGALGKLINLDIP